MSYPIEREAPVLLLVVDVALNLVLMHGEMNAHCLYACIDNLHDIKHINFVCEALCKLHKFVSVVQKLMFYVKVLPSTLKALNS